MTTIISNKDKDVLEKKAVNIISSSINNLLLKKERIIFGITGGRSVSGIFKLLKEKNIPWGNVHIFMLDERLVPIDDKESNFRLAKENFIDELISKGLLPEENVHPFAMDESKKNFGISDYEAELKKYGGVYDIILLSSGEDGHVAALYPNHHSVRDESEFYLIVHDSPKLPKDRMTISRKLLIKSKVAILLFIGEIKKDAYNNFLNHRNRRLPLTKVRGLTRRFLGCQKSLRPTTKVVGIAISKHNKI